MNTRNVWTALAVVFSLGLSGQTLQAAQDDPRLDSLFTQLQETSDPGEAQLVETYIWALWTEAHDDVQNQLMQRGTRAMQTGEMGLAISTFSQLIEIAPDFAEAWNKRATAYYMVGRYDESIVDCMKVLELEPRHFGALSGLGLIYSSRGDKPAALGWFREALSQNPHMESIRDRVEELAREVEGEAI